MTPLAYGSFNNPEDFLDAVANLRPQVAAFDCDGTLWFGDSGMKFEVSPRMNEFPKMFDLGMIPGRWMDIELVSLNKDLGEYFGTAEGLLVVRQAPRRWFGPVRPGSVGLKRGVAPSIRRDAALGNEARYRSGDQSRRAPWPQIAR